MLPKLGLATGLERLRHARAHFTSASSRLGTNQDYICCLQTLFAYQKLCGSVRNSLPSTGPFRTASLGSLISFTALLLDYQTQAGVASFYFLLPARALHRLAASLCFRDKTNLSDALRAVQAITAGFLWKTFPNWAMCHGLSALRRCILSEKSLETPSDTGFTHCRAAKSGRSD